VAKPGGRESERAGVANDPPPNERRAPRQKRALATRDAIVEGAARVFAEVGLVRATTARIAEVAGVSEGSLYQYFPSKDSLVTALFERESMRYHVEIARITAELGTDDVPRLVRAFVEVMVAGIERARPLYRVLFEEVPRVSGLGPTQAIDHGVARNVRLLLELGKDRLAARDLDVAAMLLVRTYRYATIPLVAEPLEGQAREAFIDELADMLVCYLLSPRPWRDR
jgi:AcrR family transcriptional regulator